MPRMPDGSRNKGLRGLLFERFFGPAGSLKNRPFLASALILMVTAIVAVLALVAVLLYVMPTNTKSSSPSGQSPAIASPTLSFDGMRAFVTSYYNDLPDSPQRSWERLDSACQNQTGHGSFFDFWASIGSVKLISITPRDATSVTARLKYVRRDGTSDTEDRWLRMVFERNSVLLDASDRIGPVDGSQAPPPSSSLPASAIDRLLLTADELNGVPGVHVTSDPAGGGGGALALKSSTYGTADHSGQVKPQSCVGIAFSGDHRVYASADLSAIKIQVFGENYGRGDSTATYHIEQAAALFSSAERAQEILKSSQAQWRTCASSDVDVALGYENGRSFHLGEVQRDGDVITVSMASADGLTGLHGCQEALGVRANVVVETRTCQEPSVPDFHYQEPANPAWASPTAKPLVSAMLAKVTA
jgi:hypothetical protein